MPSKNDSNTVIPPSSFIITERVFSLSDFILTELEVELVNVFLPLLPSSEDLVRFQILTLALRPGVEPES